MSTRLSENKSISPESLNNDNLSVSTEPKIKEAIGSANDSVTPNDMCMDSLANSLQSFCITGNILRETKKDLSRRGKKARKSFTTKHHSQQRKFKSKNCSVVITSEDIDDCISCSSSVECSSSVDIPSPKYVNNYENLTDHEAIDIEDDSIYEIEILNSNSSVYSNFRPIHTKKESSFLLGRDFSANIPSGLGYDCDESVSSEYNFPSPVKKSCHLSVQPSLVKATIVSRLVLFICLLNVQNKYLHICSS